MIFKTLTDIYKEKVVDDQVHEVLVKKDVITRKYIEIDQIATINEAVNTKGRIYKSKCVITLTDGTPIVLKHNFDEVVALKQPRKVNGYGGK